MNTLAILELILIIRESGIATGIGWAITAWTLIYTIDLAGRADDVTSAQWRYLMSVPGHQWSWVALFGTGTLLLALGMLGRLHRLRALGYAIIGAGSLGIAVFYALAPAVDPGLTTLGYHVWYAWAATLFFCSAASWRPVTWF